MKSFKKILQIVLCAVLCVFMSFSVAACGGGLFRFGEDDLDKAMEEELKKIDFNADETYTGQITIARNVEPDQVAVLDALVNGFTEKYKNIKVNVRPLPSANYKENLQNMNSACILNGKYDTFPDVFWASNADTTEYQLLDMMMPIDYFDGKDDSVNFNDLFPAMLADCKVGEHVYLMPRDCDRLVMYYNKDYTSAKGITIREDRAYTKTEFLELLPKLTGLKNGSTDVVALDADRKSVV